MHGCFDRLRELEALIVADAAEAVGEVWIVLLGDLIDRGPRSAQVVDHLLAPPPAGLTRFILRGNHEQILLDAFDRPETIDRFLAAGGDATLRSYGVDEDRLAWLAGQPPRTARELLAAALPVEHLAFIRSLAHGLAIPGYILVHAGLRPGLPLTRQRAHDLLWIREEFTASGFDFGALVVHGHTPALEPIVTPHRLALDTGCFATGRLSAARLVSGQPPVILQAVGAAS